MLLLLPTTINHSLALLHFPLHVKRGHNLSLDYTYLIRSIARSEFSDGYNRLCHHLFANHRATCWRLLKASLLAILALFSQSVVPAKEVIVQTGLFRLF